MPCNKPESWDLLERDGRARVLLSAPHGNAFKTRSALKKEGSEPRSRDPYRRRGSFLIPAASDATVHRRNATAASIFKTPAVGLSGLAAQARVFMIENEHDRRCRGEDYMELNLDFPDRPIARRGHRAHYGGIIWPS
jgi:hypothetical protein